jgi:hypothetical protein
MVAAQCPCTKGLTGWVPGYLELSVGRGGLRAGRPVSSQLGRQTTDRAIPEADVQRGVALAASRPCGSFQVASPSFKCRRSTNCVSTSPYLRQSMHQGASERTMSTESMKQPVTNIPMINPIHTTAG